MGRSRKQKKVENNVVWVSEKDAYFEVLDDSGPELELGRECKSVITNSETGAGHFEYADEEG